MAKKHNNGEWVDVTDQMLDGNVIKGEDAMKYLASDAVIQTAVKRSQDQRMKQAGKEIAGKVEKMKGREKQ